MEDELSLLIRSGDIFDIGQTINGRSTFIYLDKWYYYIDGNITLYQYDQKELTKLITEDYLMGYNEVKFIKNLF